MHFNTYVDHRVTRPFDNIVLYSGWLACGSRLTFPHLPECVMRQFGYTHTILRHTIVYAPSAMIRRDMCAMFDDYLSHLVLEEARSTIAESELSYVDGYIKWFFRVSHSYIVQVTPGDPSRPGHREIIEYVRASLDHAYDVLLRCCRIVEIVHTCIDRGIFPDGYKVRGS